jgi:peptide deformylase
LHEQARILELSEIGNTGGIVYGIIEKMRQRLLDPTIRAVGLAAPQIGESLAICIADPLVSKRGRILINPVIKEHSNKVVSHKEGCLSLPGIAVMVPRYAWIKIEYLDETGASHERRVHGYESRIIQHETDHLHGRLISYFANPQ